MTPTDRTGLDERESSSEAGDHAPGRAINARVHTVGCSGLRTVSIRGFRLASGDGADVAGFDLGPSPEEHLLAAVGSSLAQTIAHVACARDLSIDRIDIVLTARLEPRRETSQVGGRLTRIDASASLTSEDDPNDFSRLSEDVIAGSHLAAVLSVPIRLAVEVKPVEPEARPGDWQI